MISFLIIVYLSKAIEQKKSLPNFAAPNEIVFTSV
jgi:hypothetical protein